MTKRTASIFTHPADSGVSLTEYAILIALVGILSVAGLKALGTSTSNLFKTTSNSLDTDHTLAVLNGPRHSSSQGSQGVNGNTATNRVTGFYKIVNDPTTGQPNLQLVNSAGGTGTNVSSADGMQKTLGSLMAAQTLAQMAEEETSDKVKGYYQQLAEYAYYLGGTEGVLEDIDVLEVSGTVDISLNKARSTEVEVPYQKADALTDLMYYQDMLQGLISSPPPGVTAEDVQQVMPLVNSTLDIAQSYRDSNNEFIEETKKGDVQISSDINTEEQPEVYMSKNGKGKGKSVEAPALGKRYHELTSLGEIKNIAHQMIADNKMESAPVETTLNNGIELDSTASTGTTVTP
jgi:Flp pilus assembly pilin Flp